MKIASKEIFVRKTLLSRRLFVEWCADCFCFFAEVKEEAKCRMFYEGQ